MFERYDEKAKRAIFFASYESRRFNSRVVDSEHLLLGILREGDEIVISLFRIFGINDKKIRDEIEKKAIFLSNVSFSSSRQLPLSDEARKILRMATEEANYMRSKSVGCAHILLGILKMKKSAAAETLFKFGLDYYTVRDEVRRLYEDMGEKAKRELPFLYEYGRDLTALAAQNAFDPLIGRETELERIIEILSRRTKNNPLLLGEPGVGKTAIVEGLAQRIVEAKVPLFLIDKRIIALDLSLIVAGTKYRGQFEERLKGILKELQENKDIIVFIDEIHSLVGAGSAEGSLDAANILKPSLSRGEICCIGATTLKEYRKYIEKDRSLMRRFQCIHVSSPSDEDTLKILEGLKERYEKFHRVIYTKEALYTAVYQSSRYITDRQQPDKAIDVVDEAGAKVKLRKIKEMVGDRENILRSLEKLKKEKKQIPLEIKKTIANKKFDLAIELKEREKQLTQEIEQLVKILNGYSEELPVVRAEDISEVVSSWTGIPISKLEKEEAEKLRDMEAILKRRIVGQDRAIEAISRAIRRSRLGVSNPNRPVGSFIFLGPSGVGKTEVARRLAEFLFGSQSAMIRFDMSEYMEKHMVSKLIGSPPGYVGHEDGGQLTERVRRQPYSIILFDEIEKAHPDVMHLLLQVLEDGMLTDNYGNVVDFRNTIILMTSNLGTKFIVGKHSMGFTPGNVEHDYEIMEQKIIEELRKTFSPEFINRVDEIIVFKPLNERELRKIVDLLVEELNESLSHKGIKISLDGKAKEWILKKAGVDTTTGARPLRRTIQRYVQDKVSEILIENPNIGIGKITVTVKNGELRFSVDSSFIHSL